MRQPDSSFAFLRSEPDRWAFAEGFEDGFHYFSTPPKEGDYIWAPDFFMEDQAAFLKAKRLIFLSTRELRECLQALVQTPFSTPLDFKDFTWEPGKKDVYEHDFFDLKNKIDLGVLEKAVPIHMDFAQASHFKEQIQKSLLFIFDRMAELPESLHPFFLAEKEWMFGATPETLLYQTGGQLFTHAVAGTTADFSKNLLEDPKERSEHEFVVRELEMTLSPYGQVLKKPTFENHLPSLKHLVTEMEVDLMHFEPNQIIEIAEELHPTPALGGFPKQAAFEWLKERKDSHLRRRYGAPFGYVSSSGESHLIVAIRCLQVVGTKLISAAGAGVVKESELEKEWKEIELKKNSILKIFEAQGNL